MDKLEKLKELVIEKNIQLHASEAPIYEIIHPELFNWYHTKKCWEDIYYIFQELSSKSEINVLDLGCGTGFLALKVLEKSNANITAVDLSHEMLNELEKKINPDKKGKIRLIRQEGETFLQSNEMKFDLIMTSALLHHLVDFRKLIDLAIGHLTPNGILYIAYEPLKQPIDNGLKFIFHRLVRKIDITLLHISVKMKGITIEEDQESRLADYQTTLGGIDPDHVIECLKDPGEILKYDKFAARAFGIFAYISDKWIKSQNTFSLIFRKS